MVLGEGVEELLGVVAELTASTFAEVGYVRAPFPLPLAVALALLIVVGAVVAVWLPQGLPRARPQVLPRDGRDGTSRTDVLLVVAPVVLLVGAVLGAALTSDEPLSVAEGRHLLPGAAGLLVAAVLGYGQVLDPGTRRRLPLVVLGLGLAAQALAVRTAVDVSWGPGTGGAAEALEAWRAWVPVRSVAAAVPLLLGLGAAAGAIVRLLRVPARSEDDAAVPVRPEASRVRLVLGINVAAAVLLAAGLRLAARAGISGDELVRDTIAVVGGQLHAGLLSNLGIIVWAVGGGVCLAAAAVLRTVPEQRRWARLLGGAGLLTVVLATDDLIMFHEGAGIGPQWLGIPEALIMAAYAGAVVGLAIAYRDLLPRLPGGIVLLLALGCFAVSVAVDLVDVQLTYVVEEDIAKLLGIVNWTLGWGLAATGLLRRALAGTGADAPDAGPSA
jgi:hypothetical protein